MSSENTVISLFFVLILSLSPAHTVTAATATESMPGGIHEVRFTVEFPEEDLSFGEFSGYDVVSLHESGVHAEYGKPVLPVTPYLVAVPQGMEAYSLEARSLSRTLSGIRSR